MPPQRLPQSKQFAGISLLDSDHQWGVALPARAAELTDVADAADIVIIGETERQDYFDRLNRYVAEQEAAA